MGGYHSACCHNGGAFEIFTQNVCMAIMLGIIVEMLTIGSPALLLQKKKSHIQHVRGLDRHLRTTL